MKYPEIAIGDTVSLHTLTGSVYSGRVVGLYSGFICVWNESESCHVHVRSNNVEAVEVFNE